MIFPTCSLYYKFWTWTVIPELSCITSLDMLTLTQVSQLLLSRMQTTKIVCSLLSLCKRIQETGARIQNKQRLAALRHIETSIVLHRGCSTKSPGFKLLDSFLQNMPVWSSFRLSLNPNQGAKLEHLKRFNPYQSGMKFYLQLPSVGSKLSKISSICKKD